MNTLGSKALLDNKEGLLDSKERFSSLDDLLPDKLTVGGNPDNLMITGKYIESKSLGKGIFSDEELGIERIVLKGTRKEELVKQLVSAVVNSDAYTDRIEQRGDSDNGILLVTYNESLLAELKDIMHSYKDVIISTDDLSKAVIEAIASDKTDLAVSRNVDVDTDESRSVFVDPRLLSTKDAESGKLAIAYAVVEKKESKPLSNDELTDKVALLQSEIQQLMAETHPTSETGTETVTDKGADETETSTETNPESVTETETITDNPDGDAPDENEGQRPDNGVEQAVGGVVAVENAVTNDTDEAVQQAPTSEEAQG